VFPFRNADRMAESWNIVPDGPLVLESEALSYLESPSVYANLHLVLGPERGAQ